MGKVCLAILICGFSVNAETRIESSVTFGPDGVNAGISGVANFSIFGRSGGGSASPQVVRVEPLPSSLSDSNSFFRGVGKKEETPSRRPLAQPR